MASDLPLGGGVPKNSEIKTTQTISTATEVLPIRSDRKSALVQVSAPVYIDNSTDGLTVDSLLTWENQSALTLVPVSGSVTVKILEEWG